MTSTILDSKEILFLSEVKGLGLHRIESVLKNGFSFDELIKLKPYEWGFISGISPDNLYRSFHENLQNKRLWELIHKTFEKSDKLIFYWDDQYPDQLRRVYSPPVYLSCKGNYSLLTQKQIAIVGTRNPTNYGKQAAELFSQHISKSDHIITSGLAKGIDAIAHNTALKNNVPTVAVLGSGIDRIYPSINRNLYFNILRENGLVISEHLYNAKPDAVNFPLRNRIIAGLVQSTIVIEAGLKSGAVITANISADLGKTVYAVPGNIFSSNSDGCNLLIQEGALILTQYDDFIVNSYEHKLSPEEKLDLGSLNEIEAQIINELRLGPRHVDQLSNHLKISASDLLISLLNLEMKSLISEVNSRIFELQIS